MEYMGPASFMAVRFFLGSAVLLPVIIVRGAIRPAGKRAEGAKKPAGEGLPVLIKSGLLCGTALFFLGFLQQVGIIYTSVGKAGFITSLYMIIVPALGAFMGRRVSKSLLACIAAALAGMYLLCVNGSEPINKGDLLIFLCSFACSAHILLIDRFAPRVDSLRLSSLQFFVCGLISLAAALATEEMSLEAVWAARMPILYTGALSCGVAYTLQIVGQKYVNPVVASLLMSLEAVFAVLTGWIVLDDVLSPRETLGCMLIFAAIISAQLPDMKNR
jgi:drug/metabolite transporter (DMT)-like permease